MKRFILGLAAGAFLLLVGVQAGHHHRTAELKSCSVCAIGAQTVPHLPTVAPAEPAPLRTAALVETHIPRATSLARWAGTARAPPQA